MKSDKMNGIVELNPNNKQGNVDYFMHFGRRRHKLQNITLAVSEIALNHVLRIAFCYINPELTEGDYIAKDHFFEGAAISVFSKSIDPLVQAYLTRRLSLMYQAMLLELYMSENNRAAFEDYLGRQGIALK